MSSYRLSEHERNTLLNVFNAPWVEYPESTVIDLFRTQALATPSAVAIFCEGNTLSYSELNAISDGMAAYLAAAYRIQKGDRVAVLMERSVEMIISVLAVLKCGAVCVPLDTAYPEERVNYILHDSASVLLIVPSGREKRFPVRTEAFDYRRYRNCLVAEAHLSMESAAYIIYTSGSTGKPKGVVISHATLADYIHTFIGYFSPDSSDKMLHHSSPAFDTSVEEIFASLCSGMQLVISPAGAKDMSRLWDLIAEQGVTIVSVTPVVASELNRRIQGDSTLRSVICGGEELRPAHIDRLLGYTDVYNTYGPTESTVCSTLHYITSLAEASLIGKPLPNQKIYILDETLGLLPPGEAGEIYIAGKGLSEGYINMEIATKQRFIDNPFEPGLMFRTGDTGRWRHDGVLEFLGRHDDQVKINGNRIELAEIEITMMEDTRLEQVVVLPREERNALVAVYTAKIAVPGEELKDFLAQRLPAYMIPAGFICLDEIPLLPNGKKDRKKLMEIVNGNTQYEAPSGSLEERLAEIWRSALEKEKIGVNDHFFEMGGNSIKAVYLHTALEEKFPGVFKIADLFNLTTIRAQAVHILSKTGRTGKEKTVQYEKEITEIEL